MKASVIKEMTTEEIEDSVSNEREQLSKMKMQHAISPLDNPMVLNQKKKDIARLLTELNKRSKAAQQ